MNDKKTIISPSWNKPAEAMREFNAAVRAMDVDTWIRLYFSKDMRFHKRVLRDLRKLHRIIAKK